LPASAGSLHLVVRISIFTRRLYSDEFRSVGLVVTIIAVVLRV
jgi:hypothetical protein